MVENDMYENKMEYSSTSYTPSYFCRLVDLLHFLKLYIVDVAVA